MDDGAPQMTEPCGSWNPTGGRALWMMEPHWDLEEGELPSHVPGPQQPSAASLATGVLHCQSVPVSETYASCGEWHVPTLPNKEEPQFPYLDKEELAEMTWRKDFDSHCIQLLKHTPASFSICFSRFRKGSPVVLFFPPIE